MSLLDLPTEVLDLIAQDLDIVSLKAFELQNPHLRNVSRSLPQVIVKEREITATMLNYLAVTGGRVSSIDLSDCTSPLVRIQEVTMNCPYAAELNLVGSILKFKDVLAAMEPLKELKMLSFTLTSAEDFELSPSHRDSLKAVQRLYVEIAPQHLPIALLIDAMNACESLEECHVNIVGDGEFPHAHDEFLPVLGAERWETLRTFVCTCYQVESSRAQEKLLECIFAEHATAELQDWLRVVKRCFIYEYGNFNGMPATVKDGEEPKFLGKHLEVKLTTQNSGTENLFCTPWGKPTSLRIVDPTHSTDILQYHDLNRCLTADLVELDFSDCHCEYPHVSALDLANLAPRLETLAVSPCFLIPPKHSLHRSGRSCASSKFPFSLLGINIRKLVVKGAVHAPGCNAVDCICASSGSAVQCKCRGKLTSSTFPMLKDLEKLEELNLYNVTLDESVYAKLESSTLHTVRFNLTKYSSLNELGGFLKKCVSLKNFRLESASVLMNEPAFWRDIANGPHLDRLCVESTKWPPSTSSALQEYLGRILNKCKLFHIHGLQSSVIKGLRCNFPEFVATEEAGQTLLVWAASGTMMARRHPLCIDDSLVGFVKPIGWR